MFKKIFLALLLLLLLVIVIAGFSLVSEAIPAEAWGSYLESHGIPGLLLFIMVGVVATAVGLPRQLLAFIGGFAYGVLQGVVFSLIAALAGCLVTVVFSRTLLSAWVTRRYPQFIKTLDQLLAHDLLAKIIVLRIQPFGTNLLTNVCIGFTQASIPLFLFASAIGYIPQMLVFSLLGAGIRVESTTQTTISIVLFFISVAIGLVLYRRHVQRHSTEIT